MIFRISGHTRLITCLLFYFFFATVWALPRPVVQAESQAIQSGVQQKKDHVSKDAATDKRQAPTTLLPSPEEIPVPLQTEKIDEAGKAIGKKIDEVGRNASVRFGGWINAKTIFGITWMKLIFCGLILLLMAVADRTVGRVIRTKIQAEAFDETFTWTRQILRALSLPLSLFIRVYGIYWALSPIFSQLDTGETHGLVHRFAGKAADLGGSVALFWFIYRFINIIDAHLKRWSNTAKNSIDEMLLPLLGKILRIIVISIGSVMIMQNLTGIEVGPLVASLGIGGLAFALAAKDSIANFFGSLTILIDKPFQVGEQISIDTYEGQVESVGFRSTRIRTVTGNLVSIPNEKIITATLQNTSRQTYIRWTTNLGLTRDAAPEKVERAVEILKEILHDHEGMNEAYPPRVHFNGFRDWSLNITIFAWYFPADFWKYQEWLQKTCLEIMTRFRSEGIEFAFPTQTLFSIPIDRKMKNGD